MYNASLHAKNSLHPWAQQGLPLSYDYCLYYCDVL